MTLLKQAGRADAPRSRTVWPFVTLALIASCVVAWCAVAWIFHLRPFAAQNSALLLRAGAVNGELLRAGEWWRLVTSQFLHVHFPHFVFNMAALLLLGAGVERELGSLRFALVCAVSGTIGQAAGVLATPALVSSGASQAVMGLAGASAAISLLRRRGRGRWELVVLLAVIGITVGLDVATAGRVKAGHLVGLCAGALMGWMLSRRPVAVGAERAG